MAPRRHTHTPVKPVRPIWSHEVTRGKQLQVHYRCPVTGWRGFFTITQRSRAPRGGQG